MDQLGTSIIPLIAIEKTPNPYISVIKTGVWVYQRCHRVGRLAFQDGRVVVIITLICIIPCRCDPFNITYPSPSAEPLGGLVIVRVNADREESDGSVIFWL